jgi:hypothetical protein
MRLEAKKLVNNVVRLLGVVRSVAQRIHDSRAYAFITMTAMAVCAGFFFNVVLSVLPVYFEDAERFGFLHFNALLATTLLLLLLFLGGGCLVFCNFYYGRLKLTTSRPLTD